MYVSATYKKTPADVLLLSQIHVRNYRSDLSRVCHHMRKVRTPEQLTAELPLSRKDIEDLMYLPKGQLAITLPSIELRDDTDYKSFVEEAERIITRQGFDSFN